MAAIVTVPVRRSGLLLLLSAGVTSVLGLVYWLVAARVLDEGALGRGSAMVAAMLLVTSVGTAGLKRGLIRFVPTAGTHAPRLVARVYGFGLVAMFAFGAAVMIWAASTNAEITVAAGGVGVVLFAAGCAVWGIFVLQDAALVGARRTGVVPVSNTVFSVLKIVALVLLAAGGQAWGLVASWVVPAAVVALGVNLWLFTAGFRTRPVALEPEAAATPPTGRELLRFTGAEYSGTLVWHASMHLTPIVIVAQAGAAATAAWYLAYQIAYALFVVSSNVCDALVAESARDGELGRHLRHGGRLISALLLPAVAITVLAAPWIMGLFGSSYRADAAPVLRFLALAALPNAVTTVLVAVGHVRRRMRTVVWIQVTMAVTTLGATWLLVGRGGISAVAAGWLGAQTITAAVAVWLTFAGDPGLRKSLRTGVIDRLAAARSRVSRARADRLVDKLIAELPAGLLPSGPVTLLSHQHDVLVASAGLGDERVIVQLAGDPGARRLIAAQQSIVDGQDDDPHLDDLRRLLPKPATVDSEFRWMVQRASPGTPGSKLDHSCWGEARTSGLGVLEELHACTGEQVVIADPLLDRWVHEPVAIVSATLVDPDAARGLRALHLRLIDELSGRPARVARLHGDPSADNLLFSDDGSSVLAVVDWESTGVGLPECDLVASVLSWRRLEHRNELGEDVVALLAEGWTEAERAALGPSWSVNAHIRPTTFVLLAWLHHVAANLEKAGRYRRNRWWQHANVDRVLRELASPEPTPPDAPERAPAEPAPAATRSAAAVPAGTRVHRSLPMLRWATLITAAMAWTGWAVDLPVTSRAVFVLAATVVVPAVVLAAALAVDNMLVRSVVATGGALAANVVVSEVLLYTGSTSPGAHLAVMAALTLVISFLVPRYRAAVPPAPTPPVVLGRDRERSSAAN